MCISWFPRFGNHYSVMSHFQNPIQRIQHWKYNFGKYLIFFQFVFNLIQLRYFEFKKSDFIFGFSGVKNLYVPIFIAIKVFKKISFAKINPLSWLKKTDTIRMKIRRFKSKYFHRNVGSVILNFEDMILLEFSQLHRNNVKFIHG